MPPRPSPNAATPVCEAGRLTRPGRAAAPIEVGTAAWFRWLAAPGTTTFYVRAPAGAYTARREQRRGGHFWYAYAKRGPKLRKAYLGRPAALTWERLLEIAHTLHPLAPVLTAKLGPPPPPASAVPRPRLLARLAPPRLRALTVITAPPGYGKTTLLSQWAAALAAQPGAPPVAWLALDAEDNDPARFWALLAAAVAQAFPAAASPAQSVLAGPAPSGPAVINALFTAVPAAPLCLVLDDYHVLTAPEIHAALAFALEHLPARWHLLLTSRTEPTGLPLPRLRAQGRLAELTATDLRLTPAEAAQFLRQALGRPITPALAAALDEHTQGWAAALQLAALALAEDAGRADFPPEAQRHLFDYLAAEVLDRQPPAVQRFLTHTSLLERLSAELCAALVPDAPPDLLAGLAARQLFLTPLDAERRWYRCHPLFAEFLRARLPDAERPALHTRAAEWLAAHGDLGAAFDHALAAGNVDLAADLLDQAAEALMAEGAVATLARRVAALPPAQVQARPSLAIWQAWCAVLTGQPAVVEPSLAHAEARLAEAAAYAATAPAQAAPAVHQAVVAGLGQIAVIRAQAARQRGDYPSAAEHARAALAVLPADEPRMRALVALTLGQAHQAAGQPALAEQALAEAARVIAPAQHHFIHLSILSAQAQLEAEQGRLHAAAALYRRAQTWAEAHGGAALAAVTGLGLSALLYEWNDLESASARLAADLPLIELTGQAASHLQALLLLARVQQALGQPAAARASLATAEALTPLATPDPAFALLAAHQARLALAQGDLPAARRWAAAYPAGRVADPAARYAQEFAHLTLVRVHLAAGDAPAARALLAELLPAAEGAGRARAVLEMRFLASLAHAAAGDEPAALEALAAVLHQAEPEGYVRLLVDEGPACARLLRTLSQTPRLAQRLSLRYRHRLQQAAGLAPTSAAHPAVEPLSPRERDVLRLLAEGCSNREIGLRLGLAVGTAQWHTKRIYAKLGVRNRTQAAAQARTLGLVP